MLIVVDTNVIVSALLNPFGKPASVLGLVAEEKVGIALDSRIIEEYREVLSRPHFQFAVSEIHSLTRFLEEIALQIVAIPSGLQLKDPDDLPFIEVALVSHAEFLVTGNIGHFPERVGSLHVVTPGQFVDDFYLKREEENSPG